MQHIVIAHRSLPDILYRLLPETLLREIDEALPAGTQPAEIHLRRGRHASLTVEGRNLRLGTVLSDTDMADLLLRLSAGSPYAHEQTLREGYLTLEGGIRVGACGRAATAKGQVTDVAAITSLVLRIPWDIPQNGVEYRDILHSLPPGKGILLYAPPGGGKTTALRGAAVSLAGGDNPMRVAVVDTRGELVMPADAELMLDRLLFYPKADGISIAARTLAAEVIVCDEIGTRAEAEAIIDAEACGIPLLASAHGTVLDELLRRPPIRLLHEARCFGAYARLPQIGSRQRPEITFWEAANALL